MAEGYINRPKKKLTSGLVGNGCTMKSGSLYFTDTQLYIRVVLGHSEMVY